MHLFRAWSWIDITSCINTIHYQFLLTAPWRRCRKIVSADGCRDSTYRGRFLDQIRLWDTCMCVLELASSYLAFHQSSYYKMQETLKIHHINATFQWVSNQYFCSVTCNLMGSLPSGSSWFRSTIGLSVFSLLSSSFRIALTDMRTRPYVQRLIHDLANSQKHYNNRPAKEKSVWYVSRAAPFLPSGSSLSRWIIQFTDQNYLIGLSYEL